MPNVVQTPTNSVSPTVKLIQPFIVISKHDYSEYQGLYVQDVVATFTIPANSTVNITVKYLKGLTGINWGDGAGLQSEVDANGTRQYSHQYVNDTNEIKEYNAIFKGVTEIYGFTSTDAAFAGITELTKIRLPYTIKYIGGWSFYNTGLTELTTPYGLTEILNNTFEHSDNLKLLVISETISKLGNSSFTNTSLENIVIPDNVQTIGSYCFLATEEQYSVLKNVKIGEGISTIGRGAFSGQTSLKTMIICAVNPPLVNQVDLEPVIPTSIERIVVPIESVNLYKQAAYWSQFANKIVGYVDTNMLNAAIADVNNDLASIENRVEDINDKIPSTASSSNKLVDTNTANDDYVARDKQETFPLAVYVQCYSNDTYYDAVKEATVEANQGAIPIRNTRGEVIVPDTAYSGAAVNYGQMTSYVSEQIGSAVSNVYKIQGSASVSGLNSMEKSSSMNGYVYNMTDAGTLTAYLPAAKASVIPGDNVVFVWNNGVWYWDRLSGIIDLSGYVQKTTTIAGIDLQDNITKNELAEALGVSPDLNVGNGTINGTLTQKNLSYDQMIVDFEPNMAAYVYVKAGNTVPASAQEYLAALQSSISPTSAQLIDALTNQMASLQVIITNYKDFTGTPYEAYNAYSLDGLIKAQLDDRWGVSSSDNLENSFGRASDGAIGLGFKNKLWSPGAVSFGVDNEAGDEGYPSESIAAIATGYKTKSLGNQSFSTGYDVEVNKDQSFGGGYFVRSYGQQSFTLGRGDIENNKPLVNYGGSFVFGGSSKQSYSTTENAVDKAEFQQFKNYLAETGVITSSQAADNDFVWYWDGNHSPSENNFSIGGYIAENAREGNAVHTKGVIAPTTNNIPTGNNFLFGWWSVISGSDNVAFGSRNYIKDGSGSIALGYRNVIKGKHANFLAGYGLKSVNGAWSPGRSRLGKYNTDKANNIFEIGNGAADNARHNAFAITESGYIVLPNFDSTTSTTPISYKTFKCVNGVLTAID